MDFVDIARQYFNSNELVPVPEVVSQLLAGDTGSWHGGVTLASRVAAAQESVGQDLTSALGRLESTWTGAGADGAAAKMQHVRGSAVSASQTFQHNGGELGNTASLYENMKHQLTPMPARPDVAPGQQVEWWDLDTEAAVHDYNDAAKRNLDVYQSYVNQMQASSGDLKADYGQIGSYDGGDVQLAPTPPANGPAAHGSGPGVTGGALGGAPSSGPGAAVPHAGAHQPAITGAAAGPSADDTVQASDAGPGLTNPGGLGGLSGGPGTGTPGGTDSTYRPGGPGGTWFGSPGTNGGNGGNGSARFGGNSGSGGGRFGEPGGTSAKRPGSEPGAGNRFGSGNESGGAGRRAGGLGTAKNLEPERVPGRPGAPGGMAPGARGGKKEDDEKHERKYVLDEDVLFDGDSRTVDPETGLPPVPPTIGA